MRAIILKSCVYWMNELRITSHFYCTTYQFFSYESGVIVYCLSYELNLHMIHKLLFTAQVMTNYCLYMSYELLLTYELRVTVYCMSYELLLLHELRVNLWTLITVYCTSYQLVFKYKLGITVYCRSYESCFT